MRRTWQHYSHSPKLAADAPPPPPPPEAVDDLVDRLSVEIE